MSNLVVSRRVSVLNDVQMDELRRVIQASFCLRKEIMEGSA